MWSFFRHPNYYKKKFYIYIYIYSSSIRISDKNKIFNDQKINNDINVDKILISKKKTP